jgi:ribosomal-protein-alanine N-acetyltransferase
MTLDSSELLIRPFKSSGIPSVLAILKESPEAANWSEQSLSEILSSGSPAWVAELDREICGFLIGRVAADEFEILNMAVAPAHRRKGIASKLLVSSLEFARRSGSSRAYLEVRASNMFAIALYTSHGFMPCGKRVQYYRDPVEDALLLTLQIIATI